MDSVDSTNGFMVKFILTILITFIWVIDLRAEQSAGQTINELKGTIGKVHCKWHSIEISMISVTSSIFLKIVTVKVTSNIQGTNFFQED